MRDEMATRGRLIAQSFWTELEKIAAAAPKITKAPAHVMQMLGQGVPVGPSSPHLGALTTEGLQQFAGKTVAQEEAARMALPPSGLLAKLFGKVPVTELGGVRAARGASKKRQKGITKAVERELARRRQELTKAVGAGGERLPDVTRELERVQQTIPTIGYAGDAAADISRYMAPAGGPAVGGVPVSAAPQTMDPFTQAALVGGGTALASVPIMYAGNKYIQKRQQAPTGYR